MKGLRNLKQMLGSKEDTLMEASQIVFQQQVKKLLHNQILMEQRSDIEETSLLLHARNAMVRTSLHIIPCELKIIVKGPKYILKETIELPYKNYRPFDPGIEKEIGSLLVCLLMWKVNLACSEQPVGEKDEHAILQSYKIITNECLKHQWLRMKISTYEVAYSCGSLAYLWDPNPYFWMFVWKCKLSFAIYTGRRPRITTILHLEISCPEILCYCAVISGGSSILLSGEKERSIRKGIPRGYQLLFPTLNNFAETMDIPFQVLLLLEKIEHLTSKSAFIGSLTNTSTGYNLFSNFQGRRVQISLEADHSTSLVAEETSSEQLKYKKQFSRRVMSVLYKFCTRQKQDWVKICLVQTYCRVATIIDGKFAFPLFLFNREILLMQETYLVPVEHSGFGLLSHLIDDDDAYKLTEETKMTNIHKVWGYSRDNRGTLLLKTFSSEEATVKAALKALVIASDLFKIYVIEMFALVDITSRTEQIDYSSDQFLSDLRTVSCCLTFQCRNRHKAKAMRMIIAWDLGISHILLCRLKRATEKIMTLVWDPGIYIRRSTLESS